MSVWQDEQALGFGGYGEVLLLVRWDVLVGLLEFA